MFKISTVVSLINKCKRDYFVAEATSNQSFADYFEHVQKQLYKLTSKKKEDSVTLVVSIYAYTLPTDCIEVDALWWNNKSLELKTIEWLDAERDGWRDTDNAGDPLYFVVDKGIGKLYIYPMPDSDAITTAGTVTIKYKYRPTALPTDGTGSVSTPTEWDDIYVHHALWQTAENYRDFVTATRRSSMYHARMEEVTGDESDDQIGYVETPDEYTHANWRYKG